MAVPWLRVLNAVLGINEIARVVKGRSAAAAAADDPDQLAVSGRGGPLEARLAGVVVAALKEAFDRDHQRLELEREQIEAERARTERLLRIELARQAGNQEIGRLRLLAGVAIASWLGTLFFSARLVGGASAGRGLRRMIPWPGEAAGRPAMLPKRASRGDGRVGWAGDPARYSRSPATRRRRGG